MSRYSGRLPRTYDQAVEMLKGKRARTILNKTTIEQAPEGVINIVHHFSIIASFAPSGHVALSNAGYGSVSTRDRINAMTPPGVSFVQRQHVQRVQVPSQGIDAATGTLLIEPDGTVTV